MKVSRIDVLKRGSVGRCPNCGERTLFPTKRSLRIRPACPNCGLKFEKVEGEFLGPLVINYGITAFGLVVPIVLLYATGHLGARATIALATAAALAVPILLYRLSWSWWLMVYYFFLPENLPANLAGREETDV